MTSPDRLTDSPIGWVARHIRSYVRSDGKTGHRFHGRDALLLTTRGRKSGVLRRTALYYGRDGDRYLVVASGGGEPTHPAWYLNLLARVSGLGAGEAAAVGDHGRDLP
jgi:F420H(2)-dependent quinone reductase